MIRLPRRGKWILELNLERGTLILTDDWVTINGYLERDKTGKYPFIWVLDTYFPVPKYLQKQIKPYAERMIKAWK